MKGKGYVFSVAVTVCALVLVSCGKKKLTVEPAVSVAPSVLHLEDCTLKVYVENSGSMDGYMCPGSELKDAVKGYISSLEPSFGALELYYINSKVIPRPKDLKTFIGDLTPADFHKAGGNTANTDMGQLLETVIRETSDSVVSIFISDCILDVPGGKAVDYFYDKQIDVTAAARKFIEAGNNSIEVLQLKSHFKGRYYGTHEVTYIDTDRPYYMWVFGANPLLAEMNKRSPVDDIIHGVENRVSFGKKQQLAFAVHNKFGMPAKKIKPNRKGEYELLIHADLGPLLKQDEVLEQNSNYATSTAFLQQVTPLEAKGPYTHVLAVTIAGGKVPGPVNVQFVDANPVPGWVEDANDDSGVNIKANIDKTTGIKYLIQGVVNAYKGDKILGEVQFNTIMK